MRFDINKNYFEESDAPVSGYWLSVLPVAHLRRSWNSCHRHYSFTWRSKLLVTCGIFNSCGTYDTFGPGPLQKRRQSFGMSNDAQTEHTSKLSGRDACREYAGTRPDSKG